MIILFRLFFNLFLLVLFALLDVSFKLSNIIRFFFLKRFREKIVYTLEYLYKTPIYWKSLMHSFETAKVPVFLRLKENNDHKSLNITIKFNFKNKCFEWANGLISDKTILQKSSAFNVCYIVAPGRNINKILFWLDIFISSF